MHINKSTGLEDTEKKQEKHGENDGGFNNRRPSFGSASSLPGLDIHNSLTLSGKMRGLRRAPLKCSRCYPLMRVDLNRPFEFSLPTKPARNVGKDAGNGARYVGIGNHNGD